jgi:hypothetical protein
MRIKAYYTPREIIKGSICSSYGKEKEQNGYGLFFCFYVGDVAASYKRKHFRLKLN